MQKLKSLKFLESLSKKLKRNKRKIVLCHGDFDFLHLGHIKHFKAAKEKADYLIVSVTSDSKMQKGIGRPLYKEKERIEFLSSLSVIDFLYISHEKNAVDVISKIKPDYYAKGLDYKNLKKDYTKGIIKEKRAVEKNGGKIIFTNEQTFSASSIINQLTLNKKLISVIKDIKKQFSFEKIKTIIDKMKKKKVLIIGDTILDEYIYVKGLGKPSKENIVAGLYNDKELFLGGVFSSVGNLSSFCDNIDFITSTGNEEKYKKFIKTNIPKNIKKKLFFKSHSITTKKTRFIDRGAGHSHLKKLFEVYEMEDNPISKKTEIKILKFLNKNIKKYDLVIVNDYGHGLLTKKIIEKICKKSKYLAVNVQINAGNQGYNLVTKYKKAKYYSLDIEEAKRVTNNKNMQPKEVPGDILKLTGGKNVALTMGAQGSISCNNRSKKLFYLPSFTNVIVDTMSAGDAYFVISSMMLYLSKSLKISSFIGNLAGAITVGVAGCVPIDKSKFIQTINTHFKI